MASSVGRAATGPAGPSALAAAAGAKLAADLADLDQYYSRRGLAGEATTEAEVRFSSAVARRRLAPAEGAALAGRAQVAVFGGAGAGKSTVANILVGANVADVNAQAGYTRRPTAFVAGEPAPGDWPARIGSLLRLPPGPAAGQDAEAFDVRAVPPGAGGTDFLRTHVVWDCPDLTTKDSARYEFRAIEIAGLADVGVYVASDERYNDQLPTIFLQALLDAGTPTLVVLTKASPLDAEALVGLFREQVAKTLRQADRLLGVVAIPSPGRARRAELWTPAFPHGEALRTALRAATADPARLRADLARSGTRFLKERFGRLLEPARRDVGEWRAWTELVRHGAHDAAARFEREHLERVDYPELRAAADQLLAASRPPAPLDAAWTVMEGLRWPVRKLFGAGAAVKLRAAAAAESAEAALERLRRGFGEQLQLAAAARAAQHPLWKDLQASLGAALPRLEPGFRDLRERQRQGFEEHLQKLGGAASRLAVARPALGFALQYGRLATEAAALVLLAIALWRWGWSLLFIAIAVVAVAGALDACFRAACNAWLGRHRGEIVRRQRDDAREALRLGYEEPLSDLPAGRAAELRNLAALDARATAMLAELDAGGSGPR